MDVCLASTGSVVERALQEHYGQKDRYAPAEKLRTLVVENFPALGKVTALRFLEWVQGHPEGSVALPTGKTPEHFIKWTQHLLETWERPETRSLLETYGIEPGLKPRLDGLHFVQIDEFYPIHGWQTNSFFHYVNKYYLTPFGFDPNKALLINPDEIGLREGETLESVWGEDGVDLSLRTRAPRNAAEQRRQRLLAEVDDFCSDYESRIRALGGIGFFLGGIGPDGHIGFNVRGSDHYSTTRLCETNYETQAAAAGDLGGIEVSGKRLVITIGLGTITYNPEAAALIIAAGEAKAPIVKTAIESEAGNQVPASALQPLKNACFFITTGAAKSLTERRHREFAANAEDPAEHGRILIDAALQSHKTVARVTREETARLRSGPLLLEKLGTDFEVSREAVQLRLQEKIRRGLTNPTGERIFHTAPHHDDIMLGYLPYLLQFIHDPANSHSFNYLTSGFNAVTNDFMATRCRWARRALVTEPAATWLHLGDAAADQGVRQVQVQRYLDGLANQDETLCETQVGLRFLHLVQEIFGDSWGVADDLTPVRDQLDALETIFKTTYPGKKDAAPIQKLKGALREWEAEVLWGHLGFGLGHVRHERLGFYKGDIFTEEPEVNRDVKPLLERLRREKPTVVTVAFDPEGSGPDTHYKVMQAVAEALRRYRDETGDNQIRVWGYRNVWYRFHAEETDLIVPVSLGQIAELNTLFMNAFASQREASFPSYAYQGPFSELAAQILVEQYEHVKQLLGAEWLQNHPDPRVRAARGFQYLVEMDLDTFFGKTRALKRSIG
ncbi:hypothetical protein [Acanthopleuribacter pedis]|uniref:Glucosamine-6-phosphate deaminase n=1 Tax=Acanthopleuribacter pedis TaxID=442870 RepID=A0A8J7U496_9BACT|nr:hypothetical protein [Acanthopleuribacter pedis]MBO1318051.1 hypothetical protein [Acanthopleuribacter pedis]